MENKKPKVLVTFIEAGMGHIVSVQAISDALKASYGDKLDIVETYILRDSDNPILPKYEEYLVKNVKDSSKNSFVGSFTMDAMYIIGPQNSLRFVHSTYFRKQVAAVMEEFRKHSPDVIISTHYFLEYAALKYKRTYSPNTLVVTYCPDNNVHGWWDNRADCFYTNNPMGTQQAYDLHFASGHVREVFYPTRKMVTDSNESKEFYRKQFNIPNDKFAVVVADGGYAMAKAEDVCLELIKTDLPLTVCVIAGKNDELHEKLEKLATTVKPNITLRVFGYLENAPQLYGACDLFITKGGPNAVLDSIMMKTPVIIDYCAYPIEKQTRKLFVDIMGAGLAIESPEKIRAAVEKFIKNPHALDGLRQAGEYFDKKKNGAKEMADDIYLSLLDPEKQLNVAKEKEWLNIKAYLDEITEQKCKGKGAEEIAKIKAKRASEEEAIIQDPHKAVKYASRAAKARLEKLAKEAALKNNF